MQEKEKLGRAALFPHSPLGHAGHCDPAMSPAFISCPALGRVLPEPLNRGDPHGPPGDSCSPAEIKSQQLQLMEAAIWASKEITRAMPSFWLPSARSLHPGVAFSGSARILGKAIFMQVTAPCGPSKTSQSPSPKPPCAPGHLQADPLCACEGEEVPGTCLEGFKSVYLHTPERRSLSRDRAVRWREQRWQRRDKPMGHSLLWPSGLSLTSNSLCLCDMKWDKSSRKPPPILLFNSSLG